MKVQKPQKYRKIRFFFQILEHSSFISTAISVLFLITFLSTQTEVLIIRILDLIFIWISILKLLYGIFLLLTEKGFSATSQREIGLGIMFLALYGWIRYLAKIEHPETQLIFDQFSLILRMIVYTIYLLFNRIKIITYLRTIKLNPYQTLSLSFLAMIVLGAWLLSLPLSTHKPVGFLDTLFISTSSVCVTGLTPLDIGTTYTLFGQTIILLLIQVGGLGIMSFSFFMILLSGKKMGFQDRVSTLAMYNQEDFQVLKKVVHTMIFSTFIIEFIGAFLLFFSFPKGNFSYQIFTSLFHSISAFCNAGISTLPQSLEPYYHYFNINFIITTLIIMGGIGFPVLFNLKERFLSKQKLTLHTKIVLITSLSLIILGTLAFFLSEKSYALKEYSTPSKWLISFFQSVTTRSAGFNTIDISQLQTSTYLWLMFLMFVGAAPASTGGGMRVTNFYILLSMIFLIFKKQDLNKVYLFKQQVKTEFLIRVGISFFIRIFLVFIGVQILLLYEPFSFIQILFETVSAFGPVGLSTGITPLLTPQSKIVFICLMFIGRLEPLNVLYSLNNIKKTSSLEYSEQGYLIIGN